MVGEVTKGFSAEEIMSGSHSNSSNNNNSSMVNNNTYPQVPLTGPCNYSSSLFLPGNVSAPLQSVPSQYNQCAIQSSTPFSNFTFTSPSLVNSVQSAPLSSPSFPVSFSVPNQNPQLVVPGAGVSWQHSLPSQSLQTNFGCCNKFSGLEKQPCLDPEVGQQVNTDYMPRFQPQPSCSFFRFEPQPSCSSQPRRPKRHYDYNAEGDIPSNKVYISEEKMTKRMKELLIEDKNPSDFSCHGHCDGPTKELNRPYCTQNMKDRWKKYNKLEQSIEEGSMEDDTKKTKSASREKKNRVKFSINETFSKDIFNQEPLLPRKIIDDMLKPSLEIVLWKPPGDVVKDAVLSVIENAANDNRINHQIDKSSEISLLPQSPCKVSSQSPFSTLESSVIPGENIDDVDMFDGVDDVMDL